jgi:hypothetical protein
VDIFYKADRIPDVNNPYKGLNEILIKKKLGKLISFFMRRDRIERKKYNKFSLLYMYMNYYIKNRFFFIAEKIHNMYEKKIFGFRNKFQYLENLDFKILYPSHYDSNELLNHYSKLGHIADHSEKRVNYNNILYSYGIEYLLSKNNNIFYRLPEEYFIYLNKCYLLYMQDEENRLDLIDYSFLDERFYNSLLSMGDVIKGQNSCSLLRDAAFARSKNGLYFEGVSGV